MKKRKGDFFVCEKGETERETRSREEISTFRHTDISSYYCYYPTSNTTHSYLQREDIQSVLKYCSSKKYIHTHIKLQHNTLHYSYYFQLTKGKWTRARAAGHTGC